MNKKKITYYAIGIIVLIIGYLNYFSDEGKVEDIKKIIETTDAVYESGDYYVEAEKQYDYVDEKESKFEKAKAKIKGMLLSGDNVFLDKARNLLLNSNIIGISPSGWKISATELKYERESDQLVSNQLVSAKNEKEGIEISGNTFKTNITMDYIDLANGVTIKNKNVSISADRANYENKTKKVVLEGNIKIVDATLGDNKEKLNGNFSKVYYDLNERTLYAYDGFNINYAGIDLSGKNIVLNDSEESFKITDEVKIKYQDYVFDVNYIEKKPKSDIVNVFGKIKGGNKEYSLNANEGNYDIKNKNFSIFGDVKINSEKKEELVASKIVYNLENKNMEIFGDNLHYISPEYYLEGKHFVYNTENKDFLSDENFKLKNLKTRENIEGKTFKYNLENKNFSTTDEVKLSNSEYVLKTNNVTYTDVDSKLILPEKFEISSLKTDTKINGKDAIYNKNSGELKSENKVTMFSNNFLINGEKFNYNSKSLVGKIFGPITFKNEKESIDGNAKEILIKNGEFIEIPDEIELRQKDTVVSTQTAKYNFKDKLIHFNNKILLKNTSDKMEGSLSSATYNFEKAELKGNNFILNEPDRNLSSNNMTYYIKDKKVLFSGNVKLNDKDSKLKTQNLEYNFANKDIKLKSSSEISNKEYFMKINSGEFNKDTGKVYMTNSYIKSTSGDNFYADVTKGNINNGLIHFVGNAKGNINSQEEKINFKGDRVDLYLNKTLDKYSPKKIISYENSVVEQGNKKVESSYIEFDFLKDSIFSKNRPKISIKDEEKGDILLLADTIEVFNKDKKSNLNGNIYVKNIDKKGEMTELFADKGDVNSEQINVYNNIKVLNKDSKLTADEGHYNIKTRKIKLKGNIRMDYLDKKGANK